MRPARGDQDDSGADGIWRGAEVRRRYDLWGRSRSGSKNNSSRRSTLMNADNPITPALVVLLISLGFCVYTLVGYPMLLAVLARVCNRKVCKGPKQARVSVILPVYNGERWIAAKL